MIRILIVGDHGIVQKGLEQIVTENPDMVVSGEAADGQEALERARSNNFDVVILDIAMTGRGGLDVLRELKAQKPDVKVIVVSNYPEEQYAIRSFRDGASAYLAEGSTPEELIQAIQAVASGRRYITPSVADLLASFVEDSSRALPHEMLSDREMQVLVHIGSGKLLKEIASELNLSVKTVSTYRIRVLQKMGMETNAELVRYAILHRLEP